MVCMYLLQDFDILWHRINPTGKAKMDVTVFSQFLELTDTDM